METEPVFRFARLRRPISDSYLTIRLASPIRQSSQPVVREAAEIWVNRHYPGWEIAEIIRDDPDKNE